MAAADPAAQLRMATQTGSGAAVAAALAAGADPNALLELSGWSVLHEASRHGHLASVEALLAGGADPSALTSTRLSPLHCACAAICGRSTAPCVAALLQAGADPGAASANGWTALHAVAYGGSGEAALALLAAAPHTALRRNSRGRRPLDLALERGHWGVARCLLERCPPLPVGELLAALEGGQQGWHRAEIPEDLYAPLVARQPLTPAEWLRVPSPCSGLGAALPAVLARGEAEAALLVAHLPAAARRRLRTAALCLRRAERVHGLELPAALLRPLLLAAVE